MDQSYAEKARADFTVASGPPVLYLVPKAEPSPPAQPSRSPYSSIFSRLVENTTPMDADNGCWTWARRSWGGGYGRFDLHVPGLQRKVTLASHITMYVAHALQEQNGRPATADEIYLGYLEVRNSGLEIDHTCFNVQCSNHGHLEAVTPQVNKQRRDSHYAELKQQRLGLV